MGNIFAIINQTFPPAAQWSTDQIPDLTGKIVIVTGGNSGIGKETAKALLSHNAKVYIACRSEDKAAEAIADLKGVTGMEALFLKLDLQDLKSIKEAASVYRSKETELHVLFNNAGLMFPPMEMLTADGYDMQWGVHVLGHWYFTTLLMPILVSTAETCPEKHVRVVSTSTIGHLYGSIDNFNTLKDGPARRKLTSEQLYTDSKLGIVVIANELHRRFADKGVVSMSLHPGTLQTNLVRHSTDIQKRVMNLLMHPAPMGALTQLYGGTSPEGAEFGGKYLIPWARIGSPNPVSNDPKLGQELWKWCEEQVIDV